VTLADQVAVSAGGDGLLTAWCGDCRAHLRQVPGTDPDRALASLLATHPSDGAPHRPGLPRGWWVPASWPGALSQ
jgi:hypothetical protein